MSIQRQIAFAARSKSLCLFLGSGFSKHICPDMPDWEELIGRIVSILPVKKRKGLETLFFPKKGRRLPFEDCAEILQSLLDIEGRNLKDELANLIQDSSKQIDFGNASNAIKFLRTILPLKIITTNFDLILESCLERLKFQSYFPNRAILHESEGRKIFHIHGSIEQPGSLVVTTRDYYKFINVPNYFSLKTETMFYENTVLIIGYSANDTNLRAILDSYNRRTGGAGTVATVFMLTHSELPLHVVEHLKKAFGIVAYYIGDLEKFFSTVMNFYKKDAALFKILGRDHSKIFSSRYKFRSNFWENSSAMGLVIHAAQRMGKTIRDPRFFRLLIAGLEEKRKLAGLPGAWEQYAQLAQWLVDLGSWCDLVSSPLENIFLKSVQFSLNLSGKNTRGKSWQAFLVWERSMRRIRARNMELIRSKIVKDRLNDEVLDIL